MKSKTTISRENKIKILQRIASICIDILLRSQKRDLSLISGWEMKEVVAKMDLWYDRIFIMKKVSQNDNITPKHTDSGKKK